MKTNISILVSVEVGADRCAIAIQGVTIADGAQALTLEWLAETIRHGIRYTSVNADVLAVEADESSGGITISEVKP
jgi:hypothetical protein